MIFPNPGVGFSRGCIKMILSYLLCILVYVLSCIWLSGCERELVKDLVVGLVAMEASHL